MKIVARNPKELTRAEIISAARKFRWQRKMPKWTAIVEGRELPARPLVLEAAGVPPNDPTNSHQAVDILKRLGFETRYNKGRTDTHMEADEPRVEAESGVSSILKIVADATRKVPDSAWRRLPTDFATNIDHYLYGTKKRND